jgi:plastocyanin
VTTKLNLFALGAAVIVAGLLATSGCSESLSALGGGAKSEVAVTILPVAAEGGDGGGTGAAAVAGYGNVTGRITFSGDAGSLPSPALGKVKPEDAAICVVEKIPSQRLVVNNGGLANVFIYLQKAPKGTKEPESTEEAEVVMDHNTCTFLPHALIVRAGSPIRVLNDDALVHNVHTYPVRNGSFNSGIGAKDRVGIELIYKNGERTPVKVGCDYHTWMLAYHLPLDHPYGAVTNENGEFSISGLPAGKHQFTIWHEGNIIGKPVEVTVEPDGTATFNLELSAADLKLADAAGEEPKSVTISLAR